MDLEPVPGIQLYAKQEYILHRRPVHHLVPHTFTHQEILDWPIQILARLGDGKPENLEETMQNITQREQFALGTLELWGR